MRILVRLLLLLSGLFIGAVLLQTPSIQTYLANVAINHLGADWQIDCAEFTVALPGRLSCQRVIIKDPQGLIAEVHNVQASLKPLELLAAILKRQLTIEDLTIESIKLPAQESLNDIKGIFTWQGNHLSFNGDCHHKAGAFSGHLSLDLANRRGKGQGDLTILLHRFPCQLEYSWGETGFMVDSFSWGVPQALWIKGKGAISPQGAKLLQGQFYIGEIAPLTPGGSGKPRQGLLHGNFQLRDFKEVNGVISLDRLSLKEVGFSGRALPDHYRFNLDHPQGFCRGTFNAQALTIEEAVYQPYSLVLSQPVSWLYGTSWLATPLLLKIGKGSLEITAHQKKTQQEITLKALPLQLINFLNIDDTLSGALPGALPGTIKGTWGGKGWIETGTNGWPYEFLLQGNISHPQAAFNSTIKGNLQALQWQGSLQSGGNAHLNTSGTWELGRERSFTLALKGSMNLALISLGPNQRLEGKLLLNCQGHGTLAQPYIQGSVKLQNGLYENGEVGTILKDLALAASLSQSKIHISNISGKDVFKGSFKANGNITLTNPPMVALRGELRELMITHTDTMTILASGPLSWHGLGSKAKLSGNLEAVYSSYALEEQQSDLKALKLSDQKLPLVAPQQVLFLPHPDWFPLQINLLIKEPLILTGSGIVSRWRGDLRLGGSLVRSILTGQLDLERGYFEFVGKRLKISHGKIIFEAQHPYDPWVNLKATREDDELTFYFQIKGRSSLPQIEISSVPALPTAEILARILFNRSLSSMTTDQDFQLNLALSAAQAGSGVNFVERLRSLLGLDIIEFKQQQNGLAEPQTIFSVGKEVSENVSVQVEQGLNSMPPRVVVNIKVTPRFSIEADMSVNNATGLGVNWSKRY